MTFEEFKESVVFDRRYDSVVSQGDLQTLCVRFVAMFSNDIPYYCVLDQPFMQALREDMTGRLWYKLKEEFGGEERTCHNLKDEWPSLFKCDECGYDNSDTYTGSEPNFKFCPNCGAKVVK